jgi:hypothetical protein
MPGQRPNCPRHWAVGHSRGEARNAHAAAAVAGCGLGLWRWRRFEFYDSGRATLSEGHSVATNSGLRCGGGRNQFPRAAKRIVVEWSRWFLRQRQELPRAEVLKGGQDARDRRGAQTGHTLDCGQGQLTRPHSGAHVPALGAAPGDPLRSMSRQGTNRLGGGSALAQPTCRHVDRAPAR